jgi:hypothetical protein
VNIVTPSQVAVATPPPQFIPKPTPTQGSQDNWVPGGNPTAPVMDAKLVGVWTTKVFTPSGSITVHWEQLEDGRYSISRAGGPPDTGTMTAQNGSIHVVSTTTGMTKGVAYELKSTTKLQTYGLGDPGPVIWTRTSSGTSSSGKSGSTTSHSKGNSGNDSSSSTTHPNSRDWRQYIPQNLPGRFPRPF